MHVRTRAYIFNKNQIYTTGMKCSPETHYLDNKTSVLPCFYGKRYVMFLTFSYSHDLLSLPLCVCMWGHACHCAHMVIRGQLCGVCSPLPSLHGFQGLDGVLIFIASTFIQWVISLALFALFLGSVVQSLCKFHTDRFGKVKDFGVFMTYVHATCMSVPLKATRGCRAKILTWVLLTKVPFLQPAFKVLISDLKHTAYTRAQWIFIEIIIATKIISESLVQEMYSSRTLNWLLLSHFKHLVANKFENNEFPQIIFLDFFFLV